MKISRHFLYIIGFIFFGCSPTYTLQSHEEKVIEIQEAGDSSIIAIIAPYQPKFLLVILVSFVAGLILSIIFIMIKTEYDHRQLLKKS